MRAAQREPEKGEDLIVRIAGYSARFAHISKIEDAIIARTVQEIRPLISKIFAKWKEN